MSNKCINAIKIGDELTISWRNGYNAYCSHLMTIECIVVAKNWNGDLILGTNNKDFGFYSQSNFGGPATLYKLPYNYFVGFSERWFNVFKIKKCQLKTV